ncbi:hypothetical protein Ga0080574_TMP2566 [Salipiger abyssi]|uniref:Uncharacterized protein n=1 Tax=Salipiger abyssi TaxID=1250539 RepID=A0A1P8UU35_9RHOB|nr:hypothetical protein Ga0080574_TMP2566 [Salipiger abyssi]
MRPSRVLSLARDYQSANADGFQSSRNPKRKAHFHSGISAACRKQCGLPPSRGPV